MSSNNANKMMSVKNRAPAAIQISAEQILREAADRQQVHGIIEPVIKIHDQEEYTSHLRDRRKHFEDNIRYRREHIGNWIKYARFEEDVAKEMERARSVMERALEVDHRSSEIWLRYIEMELRNENINHARNVLDRAVQILPRIDALWYKYVYMEEMVGDIPKCRAVFDRWCTQWLPDDNAWISYAKFETRHGLFDNARNVWQQYINTYPCARAFLKYAKWAEQEAHDNELTRTIYEAALTELEPEEVRNNSRLFKQFASFEERQGEYERARVIYKHAIKLLCLGEENNNESVNMDDQNDNDDNMDDENELKLKQQEKKNRDDLYKSYINFEKKRGNKQTIEHVIITRQRKQYQQRVMNNPYDYDGWFEWAKLEQDQQQELHQQDHSSNGGDDSSKTVIAAAAAAAVRNVCERAVANVPPTSEDDHDDNGSSSNNNKDHWRRYIYLWIYYAVYEELINHDLQRACKIYETCLSLIPHEKFTFTKIWILAAQLHVRRRDLPSARKLLGKAIGICSNSANNNKKQEKIFVAYIALELALGEVDRCRAIYTNYIKTCPTKSMAWNKYAELEKSLSETERCRAIYELAISQSALDMPEMLWKGYIDFEIDEGQGDHARQLYERLLEKTNHVKVWISYAQFEASAIGQGMTVARSTFERAYEQLKEQGLSEERVLLLDAWRLLEKSQSDDGTTSMADNVAKVEAKMPRRLKRKRLRLDENGNEIAGCWEEYFDYQFPDDDQGGQAANHFKILEMAAKWKEQQQQQQQDNDDSDSDDSSDDD